MSNGTKFPETASLLWSEQPQLSRHHAKLGLQKRASAVWLVLVQHTLAYCHCSFICIYSSLFTKKVEKKNSSQFLPIEFATRKYLSVPPISLIDTSEQLFSSAGQLDAVLKARTQTSYYYFSLIRIHLPAVICSYASF